MPVNTLKVDRTTPFGNPFRVEDYGHHRALALHRAWILGKPLPDLSGSQKRQLARRRTEVLAALKRLRGKNLACWCPLPKDGERDSCHAAILVQLANA
jgi:hypothetical protein